MKQNFIRCGLAGIFIEVFFTGMGSLLHHDYSLTGHSSILMFPIYGSAALFGPISKRLHNQNFIVRGLIYTCCIYAMEFFSGALLRLQGICPWDYSADPTNIAGLIRLDFAPWWFIAGLIFERISRLPAVIVSGLSGAGLKSDGTSATSLSGNER